MTGKMTVLSKALFVFTLVLALVELKPPLLEVTRVSPFSANREILPVDKLNKEKLLKDIEEANHVFKFRGVGETKIPDEVIVLENTNGLIAFTVRASGIKSPQKLSANVAVPEGWSVECYRKVFLHDWYSSGLFKKNLLFIGDALVPLLDTGNGAATIVRPDETAVVVFKIKPNSKVNGSVSGNIQVGKMRHEFTVPFVVIEKDLPLRPFNSIVFNSNNHNASPSLVLLAREAGMTHLQVNNAPSMIFDKKGGIVKGIDVNALSSVAFRAASIPWLNEGGRILLFWQTKYEKLIKTKEGIYLPFLSKNWTKGYLNLLRASFAELEKYSEDFSLDKVSILLADEVSENKNDNIKKLSKLAKTINREFPQIEVVVSYGVQSGIKELATISKSAEITLMHFPLPENYSVRGEKMKPKEMESFYMKQKRRSLQRWSYLVAKGKSADLRDFLVLPIIAAVRGDEGFSWWAFLGHVGSSWTTIDSGAIDYSLVYVKEQSNPICNYWNPNDASSYSTSVRLLAVEEGLLSASLMRNMMSRKNTLSYEDLKELNELATVFDEELCHMENFSITYSISMSEVLELMNRVKLLYAKVTHS